MISDSGQRCEELPEDMSLTKTKRDQFLVDIRKKKNQKIIHEKRLKAAQNGEISEQNPFMAPSNLYSEGSLNQQDQLQLQFSEQCAFQLKLAYDRFQEAYETQNWEDLLMVIQPLREAVGSDNSPIMGRNIIEMGIIPRILDVLNPEYSKISKLQSEAAWLIANISGGVTEDNIYLVEQNCIKVLCDCLKTTNEELHENTMWALANLALERETDFRNLILDAGVLKEVTRQLTNTYRGQNYSRTAMWLISNLLKKPSPDFDKVSISVGILAQLIGLPDEETQKLVLQSLMFFSELNDPATFYVISAYQLIPKIVKFIAQGNPIMIFYALRTVGNLTLGDEKITLQLCENNILETLGPILVHKEMGLRKEACYIISNILADRPTGQNDIIQNKIIPQLFTIIKEDESPDVKYEAISCIYIFVQRCTLEEAEGLVARGVVEILVQNLQESALKILRKTLETLKDILRFGEHQMDYYNGLNPIAWRIAQADGVTFLENLTENMDEGVASRASQLIDGFFSKEGQN